VPVLAVQGVPEMRRHREDPFPVGPCLAKVPPLQGLHGTSSVGPPRSELHLFDQGKGDEAMSEILARQNAREQPDVEALLAAVNRGEESVVVQKIQLADGSPGYCLRPVVASQPEATTRPPRRRAVPLWVWLLLAAAALAALVAVGWTLSLLVSVIAAHAGLVVGGVVVVVVALGLAGRSCHIIIQHWH
jgi:hypothetical protein